MNSGRVLAHPAFARKRFTELAATPEPLLDLTEASLIIALEEYPSIDVERYLRQIEEWSDAIRDRIEGSRDTERIVDAINRLLYEQEGFHGEADDLYDPKTTFLNEVLDRHAGLPLSLSIVYIELSRRLGLEMSGVALPGRFLVKLSGPLGDILIDPFDDGRVLTTAECQSIIDQTYGGGVRLREHHLRGVSKREIVQRLLAHLKSLYLAHDNLEGAAGAVDRMLILDDRDAWELRDRGLLAMRLYEYQEAISYLERYLALAPHADDRQRVKEEILYLKAWLAQN